MTAVPTEQHAAASFTRRAWWSLLGFMPSFALAFLIGEGILSALGYPSEGEERAPWWAVATAAIPALVVFVLPAVTASYFGSRAMRLGDSKGRTPMVVAIFVAGAFLVLNGFSALTILLS